MSLKLTKVQILISSLAVVVQRLVEDGTLIRITDEPKVCRLAASQVRFHLSLSPTIIGSWEENEILTTTGSCVRKQKRGEKNERVVRNTDDKE